MNPFPFVVRLLQRHFFQPQEAQSLSLFRFLYCAALFWTLAADGPVHLGHYSGMAWYPIPLFELFHVPLMSPETFQALHAVLLGALALTALGVFTRVSATVAWVTFFFYMGTDLGFCKSPHVSYVSHTHNIVVFILFILSIAPDVAFYGFDGWRRRGWRWLPADPSAGLTTAWPSQLVKLTLGVAYFGAGYCKVATHPLWADGYTLQAYLMAKHLMMDIELAAWVAEQWWLCLALGIATLVLELTFFLVVFYPRLTWIYVASALAFHGAIYLTMHINFFAYFGWAFLIFLDWPTLKVLARPLRLPFARREAAPAADDRPLTLGDTLGARCAVLGLWGVLAVCVYARIESWPFSDYRVYASRNHVRKVCVYRIAATDSTGKTEWIPCSWLPLAPTQLTSRIGAHLRPGKSAALQRLLDDMAAQIARNDPAGRYQRVTIVERTLKHERESGRLQAIDRPVLADNIAAAAARSQVEIARRNSNTKSR